VISIRPKWDEWSVSFELHVDNDTITVETVKEIVENAGKFVGVGSFTPRCNGSFGRFDLMNLELIN
jgi:hypothetical protein